MPTLLDIEESVCKVFAVTPDDLMSHSRKRPHVEARFALIRAYREKTRLSQAKVANMLHVNPNTIFNAEHRCKELCDVYPDYASKYLSVIFTQ